jgi:hypothetical protein
MIIRPATGTDDLPVYDKDINEARLDIFLNMLETVDPAEEIHDGLYIIMGIYL